MIVDGHVHAWPGKLTRDTVNIEVERFGKVVSSARKNGIQRLCVSCPRVNDWSNDLVLRVMEAYPDEVLGFCFVDPRDQKEALEEIERCLVHNGMVGVKLHIQALATSPLLDPIVERVTELGGVILQHAWYKTTGNLEHESTPRDVADLARRHPEARIQMAHLNGAGYKGVLEIAPHDNIYIDVSGGYPEAGIIERAVEVLGPQRIIFGSDAPLRDFSVQLTKVTGADITDEVKQMILFENIAGFLRGRLQ